MKKYGFTKALILSLGMMMSTSLNTYAYETPANPLTADALEAEEFIQDSYDAKGYMMEVLFAYAPALCFPEDTAPDSSDWCAP